MNNRKMKTNRLGFMPAIFFILAATDCGGTVSGETSSESSMSPDFEGGVKLEWASDRSFPIGNKNVQGLFNDRNPEFNPATQLKISKIPSGSRIDLSFDLYLIGTWDSGGKQADRWTLGMKEGGILLDLTTFPNRFKDPGEKVPDGNEGFVRIYRHDRAYWMESRRVSISPDQIRGDSLVLVFRGYLTGRKTEFWAIDNVRVTIHPIASPR
ncbi:MAG TPA: hypothetical protein PKV75_09195 [Desulfobacterales bacterium]|nr:hypothetical protein [Desulfobacterales bacterium]